MKVFIEKQYDKLGDSFMKEDEVVVEIYGYKNEIVIKMDDNLYAIPKSVIKVVMEEQ